MSELPTRYDRPLFGGEYDPQDEPVMKDNMAKVKAFMLRYRNIWFTKLEIARGAGLPEGTDPTPRVRDLRKAAHGNWVIEKKRIDGKYRYRLTGEKNPR